MRFTAAGNKLRDWQRLYVNFSYGGEANAQAVMLLSLTFPHPSLSAMHIHWMAAFKVAMWSDTKTIKFDATVQKFSRIA